jgi:pimeloyl-ACP methyl ester carboxylesterase
MSFVTLGGEHQNKIELYYEDHGSGSPVVLIQGWPLSRRSFGQQVSALVDAGYRVITYDRRGFGRSSQPVIGYDYDTLAADLPALLEHLDVDDVTILGLSMGGGEVVRYLGTYGSALVAKAVFASAVPPFLHITKDNPQGGLDDAAVAAFATGIRSDRVAYGDPFATGFRSVNGRTAPLNVLGV